MNIEEIKKYRLVIFDADGTLTPMREGSLGEFSYTLLPGIKEMCQALWEAGIKVTIASNQSEWRSVENIKRQLSWTANEVNAAYAGVLFSQNKLTQKPSPHMLCSLMGGARMDVCPSETLFVGDAETDRQAAVAAGIDFCWAKDFFGEKGD